MFQVVRSGSAMATFVVTINTSGSGSSCNIITTIAGNGTAGYSGDGGPATAASMNTPEGIVFDSIGNLYIADWGNNCIRKISTSGIISTILNTSIYHPHIISIDRQNNLYIPDDNDKVWKYNLTTSTLSTFAGTGASGYSGDGGPATDATFTYPLGTYVDLNGNVYISGTDNRIRIVDTFGIINTIAGNGTSSYTGDGGPATAAGIGTVWGMTTDNFGNLYIACTDNYTIRKIDNSGIITTIAGTGVLGPTGDGGPATNATLSSPLDIFFDAMGNAYISCGQGVGGSGGNVRKISSSGIISTIVGNGTYGFGGDGGPATAALVSEVYTTKHDAFGNLYLSDIWNNRIRKVTFGNSTLGNINGDSSVCLGYTIALSDTSSGGGWSSSNTVVATISSSGTVTGVSTGTAIISYTVTNICGSIASTMIMTVNLLPNAGTISGLLSVCVGSNIILTDLASGGIWSSTNSSVASVGSIGVVTGVSAGTSIISYTVSNGCGSAFTTTTIEQWTVKSPMITARQSPGAAAVGNIIYVIGGANATTIFNTNEAYNTLTNTWTTQTPMPTARSEEGVATVNGKIYAIGGYNGSALNTVEEYDPTSNTWSTKSSMPTARSQFSIGVVGNNIYAIGGFPGGLTTVEEYNTVTDTWTTKAPFPFGVEQVNSCVTLDEQLYFFGGKNNTNTIFYSTNEIYDTLTNSWSAGVNLPAPRFGGAATVLNNQIYYFGGSDGSVYYPNFNNNYSFDSISGSWVNKLQMLNNRSGIVAVSVNGNIYVIGGFDSVGNPVNWNQEYSIIPSPITVNPLPSAGTITGSSSICLGNNISLTDTISGGTWSSTNTLVATVGSTGIVNGTSDGTTTISYTISNACGSVSASKVVTVNISISTGSITGPSSVCVGSTITLSNATTGGTWSSNVSQALIGSTTGILIGVGSGVATITYALPSGCFTTTLVTVNPLPLTISGNGSICLGATTTLNDAATGGTWSSSNSSIAPITSGVVSGLSIGTATITYILPTGCITTTIVTVNPTTSPITGVPTVCVGQTSTLNDATPLGNWYSSSPSIAGVILGTVYGNLAGTTTISYVPLSGCIVTTVVTVNGLPPTIGGNLSICHGSAANLTDVVSGGTWNSSNSSIATINTSTGFVSGIIPGTSTIEYTALTGCSISTVITVNSLPEGIDGSLILCPGSTISLSDYSSPGTWTSENTTIATINATTGIVSGLTTGTSNITYTNTITSCSTSSILTVTASPASIGGGNIICSGSSFYLTNAITGGTWATTSANVSIGFYSGNLTGITIGTATVTYINPAGCSTSATVTVNSLPSTISGTGAICIGHSITLSDPTTTGTWSSLGGVNIGSLSGIVTGVTSGTATIYYTLPTGCNVNANVTVNPLPEIIIGYPNICTGLTTTLIDYSTGGTWSATGIVSIGSATGIVSTTAPGTSTITYTLPTGCLITTIVTVQSLPTDITGTTTVCVGGNLSLTDATSGGAWSSNNISEATIGSTGIVSAIFEGTPTITYTLPTGCITTKSLLINPLPLSISGNKEICIGATIALSDISTGGLWSVGGSIVSVGSMSGIVSGFSLGTAVVTYTLPTGCVITTSVTVNPYPYAIAGSSVVCQGGNIQLSDITIGGLWNSGDTLIATANADSGIVIGVAGGSANISYTSNVGCTVIKTVTVNAIFPISGSDNVCVGSTIILSDGVSGGTWSDDEPLTVASINESTGTISSIASGVTRVIYSLSNGCKTDLIITVNPIPSNFYLTGGGAYCIGGSGVNIGLDGSDTGIVYKLYHGTTFEDSLIGNGDSLNYGLFTTSGVYTIQATNLHTGCTSRMDSSAIVTINSSVLPLVSLTTSTGTTPCVGESVLFTATPTNGGLSPAYRWYVNSSFVASGSGNSYTYTPSSGDSVSVVLNSDAMCANPDTALAKLIMSTTTNLIPTVTINVTPSDSLCPGTPVTLTPTATNGGTFPTYTWYKNGISEGSSATYTFMPINGDNLLCELYSSLGCATPNTAYSNNVNMIVPPIYVPMVTVTAYPSNRIAVGESDTFVASVVFSGLSYTMQWEINSVPVAGSVTDTFISSTLGNRDTVSCIVTGESICGSATRYGSVVIIDTNVQSTGIQQLISGSTNIMLIPNPNNGTFKILGTLAEVSDEEITIEITDMLGRSVYENVIHAQNGKVNYQVQLSNTIANGIYLLSFRSVIESKVFHVVVEQ